MRLTTLFLIMWIPGEYAYALALLLFPLAMQAKGLVALHEDKKLPSAVIIVGTFELFGGLLLMGASTAPEPSAEFLPLYLQLITLAGYFLVVAMRVLVSSKEGSKHLQGPLWEGPKMVVACVVAYFCSVTALLNWPVAMMLALTHVPMLGMARPVKAKSVASWCLLPTMLISMPACWPMLLGAATGGASGSDVVLQWLRWYRLSGLLNVPLLCLVSIPAHLTSAFILISPTGPVKQL